MKIVTRQLLPTIWSAIDDDTYDGAWDSGCNQMGLGKTEAEAIADLKLQLEPEVA